MCDALVTMGNPLIDASHERMTLDTHDCVDAMVVYALHAMEALSKEQYCKYLKDGLVDRT